MAESTGIRLPSCVTCGLASAVAVFCLGLGSGAAGGLLLGMMAITVLQSLELLADNRPLMDQLELYIVGNDYYLERKVKEILQWETYNEVHDIHISLFAELFGVFSSAFSLAAGIFVGSSTYALVVKILGEVEVGKALVSAGSVCLTVITAIGYTLGPTLESFLTSTLNVNISSWFMISVVSVILPLIICFIIEKWFKLLSIDNYIQCVLVWLSFTPGATLIIFLATFFSNTRLILSGVLVYTDMMSYLDESLFTKTSGPSVPLMLIIADVFNIAEQPIVTLQAPAPTNTSSAGPTNTSSALLESIFIGVLTTQMWMAGIGTTLFVSLQRGEAGKICATATAAGSAVFGVIKLLLPALGPGPTIGALTGVTGAVGVALAAAEAATDEYGRAVKPYRVVGKVGVTVGAAVGAFLYSLTHSGLSGWFMALCAATIPAGHKLFLLLSLPPSWWLKVCLCIYLLLPVVLMSFTYTGFFYILFMTYRFLCLFYMVIIYAIFFYVLCPPVLGIDGHRTSIQV